MSWLLSLDACDSSARTAKGETALHLSAIRGDERVCETLINGGCTTEAVTLEGKTALHLAAEMGKRGKDRGERRRVRGGGGNGQRDAGKDCGRDGGWHGCG